MVNINNLIPKENKVKVEEVQEIENHIPSYEEFLKTYENEQVNYDDLTHEDINTVEGYGPCNWANPNCECYLSENFIPLYVGCSASYCNSTTPTSWFHAGGYNASSSKNTSCGTLVISGRGSVKCSSCGTENSWSGWRFACSNHPGNYGSFDRGEFMNSLTVYNNLSKNSSYIKKIILQGLIRKIINE